VVDCESRGFIFSLSLKNCRYTQCELMSVHYKQPILLIEFEENKSFSLEVRPTPQI
jgi:ERCC4-type nuclease